jgi:tRNA A37 threonylcarbamoyladenosine biosynthesis protein TsaE
MDAYRIDSALEAEELDLEAMLAQGALLIEWPERIRELIPVEHLWIDFEHVREEERAMKIRASGKRYERLVDTVRQASNGGG